MAVEDYIAEATTEINAAKPINKNSNGEVIELSDAEYDAKITALATQKDYDANQSYKDKRAAEKAAAAAKLAEARAAIARNEYGGDPVYDEGQQAGMGFGGGRSDPTDKS